MTTSKASNLAASYARTIVPIIVGAVIGWALKHNMNLHGYTTAITAAVTAVYYAVVRAGEHFLSPEFGWLLGYAKPPDYTPAPVKRPARKKAAK